MQGGKAPGQEIFINFLDQSLLNLHIGILAKFIGDRPGARRFVAQLKPNLNTRQYKISVTTLPWERSSENHTITQSSD
jgi:hypothetical protein